MTTRHARPAYDQPSRAAPVDGEVAVSGPENLAYSLTPQAARATADSIRAAADRAEETAAAPRPPP